jgi:hypothetical protein
VHDGVIVIRQTQGIHFFICQLVEVVLLAFQKITKQMTVKLMYLRFNSKGNFMKVT